MDNNCESPEKASDGDRQKRMTDNHIRPALKFKEEVQSWVVVGELESPKSTSNHSTERRKTLKLPRTVEQPR
jgi:hypothetical protein